MAQKEIAIVGITGVPTMEGRELEQVSGRICRGGVSFGAPRHSGSVICDGPGAHVRYWHFLCQDVVMHDGTGQL